MDARTGLQTGSSDVRFMAIVVVTTLALLVIQLVLGFVSHSLALLADSAHSGADVLCYGLNLMVEYLKGTPRVERPGAETRANLWSRVIAKCRVRLCCRDADAELDIARADEIGCVLSTVVLVIATGSATTGAVNRILGNEAPQTDSDDEYSEIGPALLLFSSLNIVSVLLVLYCRWAVPRPAPEQQPLDVATIDPPCTSREAEFEVPAVPDFSLHDASNVASLALTAQSSSDSTPAPPSPNQWNRQPKKKERRASVLNLRRDFSAGACRIPDCEDPACVPPSGGNDRQGLAQDPDVPQWFRWGRWHSRLHSLVHPGCECESEGLATPAAAISHPANLNMLATLLHLIADLLRGIVILAAASFIQAFNVENPGEWDAWCAILVAILVLMGSAALLWRVANARCCGKATGNIATGEAAQLPL